MTAVHAEDWEVRENAFYTLLGSSGLVALGRHAVDRLTGYLGDSNYVYRMVATAVLGEMLGPEKGAPLDPSAVGRIKAALVRASADESASVRERAVGGLALLPGDDVTNLLVELAERDAHRDPGGSLRAPRYPVREAARKALEKRGSNR